MILASMRPCIPLLGGLGMFIGCIGAVLADYKQQCRLQDEQERPQQVLVRHLSRVTRDPESLATSIFLLGMLVYAPCVGLTGFWQSEVLGEVHVGHSDSGFFGAVVTVEQQQHSLVWCPLVSGAGGFLMAAGTCLLPYATYPCLGSFVHVLTSSMLVGGSIFYCMRMLFLGAEVFGQDSSVYRVRLALVAILWVSTVMMMIVDWPAMKKVQLLDQYENEISTILRESEIQISENLSFSANHTSTSCSTAQLLENDSLTPDEVWNCRKWQAAFAVLQMMVGCSVCISVASGAAEVAMLDHDA